MQKVINDPNAVVDEMLEGYVKAYPDLVARTVNPHVLKYRAAPIAADKTRAKKIASRIRRLMLTSWCRRDLFSF